MRLRIRLPSKGSGHRSSLIRWSCWLVLLALGAMPLHAEVAKEDQLKAAFLYNFTKFVEWSPGRFASETSPIVIGVLGANPFGDELAAIVKSRTVNGRPITVRTITNAEEARSAHVVFVDTTGEAGLGELIAVSREAGVLTVGESPEFAARRGIINFTIEGNRVRFEINQAAGEQAGLRISAQLLKLATVVRREN